ncbi:MAG TPA: prepilin-type N-terminal cleavage/methylation domain-containing protein [Bryobacteraceae bacterium]|nr:prepilin-type N-terminal cleavage/methylation domain-containing protein [Bryobacteraceae bacterium]
MSRNPHAGRRRSRAGVTLIEVLIAMTLLSLLSVGILIAMEVGLSAFGKTDTKLMDNRRSAGAERILEQELEGMVPVVAPCGIGPKSTGTNLAFFEGEAQVMRLVSTFSLHGAWRGQPQILELFTIPGEEGAGVRLVVNEIPYIGPATAGQLCLGQQPDPVTGLSTLHFAPVEARPNSFVLADKLAYCRFSYLTPSPQPNQPPRWLPTWTQPGWPLAVRVQMAPLEPDRSRVQPISVTAPVNFHRAPEIQYGDF